MARSHDQDDKDRGDDAVLGYALGALALAVVVGIYALWAAAGVIIGLSAALIAARRRYRYGFLASIAGVSLATLILLILSVGPGWLDDYRGDLLRKNNAQLQTERQEARETARASDTEYVDPDPERAPVAIWGHNWERALSQNWLQLLLAALPVAGLTFAGFSGSREFRRRREDEQTRRELVADGLKRNQLASDVADELERRQNIRDW